jgi:hypothetical protein
VKQPNRRYKIISKELGRSLGTKEQKTLTRTRFPVPNSGTVGSPRKRRKERENLEL